MRAVFYTGMAGQDMSLSLKSATGLWLTVKLVCSRVKDEDGDKIYQGAVLSNYNPTALKACGDKALADINQLEKK